MQPNFSAESEIYKDRLTDKYRRWNNPFRMLIDKAGFVPGNDLILGSDGMPTGIEGALHNSLFPTETGQQLSINEFVAAYCTNNLNKGFIDVNVDFDNKTTNFNVIIK